MLSQVPPVVRQTLSRSAPKCPQAESISRNYPTQWLTRPPFIVRLIRDDLFSTPCLIQYFFLRMRHLGFHASQKSKASKIRACGSSELARKLEVVTIQNCGAIETFYPARLSESNND